MKGANQKAKCRWFEAMLLTFVFLPLLGCATVQDTKTASGHSAEAGTEPPAVPQEVASAMTSRSSAQPAASRSTGEFFDKVGKHATAAVTCGALGARFGMESARFLSVLALPLIPAGAAFGIVAGAYEGRACEFTSEPRRSP